MTSQISKLSPMLHFKHYELCLFLLMYHIDKCHFVSVDLVSIAPSDFYVDVENKCHFLNESLVKDNDQASFERLCRNIQLTVSIGVLIN